jgi:hypothetical protein
LGVTSSFAEKNAATFQKMAIFGTAAFVAIGAGLKKTV